ncbi:MAG: hypothetical protein WCA35_07550 [Kovacikia sp.]
MPYVSVLHPSANRYRQVKANRFSKEEMDGLGYFATTSDRLSVPIPAVGDRH